MLLNSLETSYELRKRIFNVKKKDIKKSNLMRKQKIMIDLTKREYRYIVRLGIDFFELVNSFGENKPETCTVFGAWQYAEYKPVEGYEKEKRLVYRYYIYFDFDEKLESKCV